MWAPNLKRRSSAVHAPQDSGHGLPEVTTRATGGGDSLWPVASGRGPCQRCKAPESAPLCGRCTVKTRRSRAFFRFRVGVLLTILAGVLIWAGADIHRRRARTLWNEPLDIALVLLCKQPVDAQAIRALHARKFALEDRLGEEFHRFSGAAHRPFRFTIYDAVDASALPPVQPDGGVWDLVRYNFDLWWFARKVNAGAQLDASQFDATIYVVARPPKAPFSASIEGASQEGGTVGVVEVELDPGMVDFALIVATHELLHTLGASDKYDAVGRSLVPDGLPEPDRIPLYPQRFAEVMARNVALGPVSERPPESLSELMIGQATAREIRWLH